ncbi:hypothetical protein [Leptospira weilii]|uniref:hypothetical protein n=1 Tax=Leptospira weilii TaxID=28184 RepID=UPI001EF339E6|nr:hypothetical protein [Leptospira weilii]ULH29225.1 hypothetical protein FH586_04725 [Leptospira weilii]
MLKDAIARLKRRVNVSNVLKSGDNEPDLKALASKATTLLDAGSIAADTDKIKEWAIAQGVDEESATNFASDVVDAYFDDTSDEIQKSENGSDEDEEEEKKKEQFKKKDKEDEREEIEKAQISFIFNVQNALEVLKSNQETLAAAIEHLLDRSEENLKFKDDFLKLKSDFTGLSNRPANEKTPVMTVQKSNSNTLPQNYVSVEERDKVGQLIIKGMECGQCFLEDVSYFQSTWKLSDRASKFVNEFREVQK